MVSDQSSSQSGRGTSLVNSVFCGLSGLLVGLAACQPGVISGTGSGFDESGGGGGMAMTGGAGGGGGVISPASTTATGMGGMPMGGAGGVAPEPTGFFALVGAEGAVVTTEDGESLTTVQPPTGLASDDLRDVTFGANRFFAVGGTTGQGLLYRCDDGVFWHRSAAAPPESLAGVTWFDTTQTDLLVAVGENGSRYYSTDFGGSLTLSATAAPSGHFLAVASGGGLAIAVGQDAGGSGMISTSADGKSWSTPVVGGAAINDIVFGLGVFVAVGAQGRCSTSTDGITWLDAALSSDNYTTVSYVSGTFIVGGASGEFRSSDGSLWQFAPASARRSHAYGGGLFLAVGDDALLYRSSDEMSWAQGATAVPAGAISYGVFPR